MSRPAHAAEPILRDEVAKAVRAAVDDLPRPHRAAVELAYFGGLTYREVAVALGVAEGTAKSWLRQALRRLADRLTAEGIME